MVYCASVSNLKAVSGGINELLHFQVFDLNLILSRSQGSYQGHSRKMFLTMVYCACVSNLKAVSPGINELLHFQVFDLDLILSRSQGSYQG